MAVVKCNSGHFYDDSKFDECPHCKNGLKHIKKETYVDDLEKLKTETYSETLTNDYIEEKTVKLEAVSEEDPSEERTIGFYSFEDGTELITGWLVCVKGKSKGRDYRLFHGWNRIGRSINMDICISDDNKISSDNQAAIVFDDRRNEFYLVNEEGSLTYLNGVHSTESSELKTGDRISVGDTELIFIAFCTEERKWEDYE